jgi:hypothetical protein
MAYIWSTSGLFKLILTQYIVVSLCHTAENTYMFQLMTILYRKFYVLFSFLLQSDKYRELRGAQYNII